MVSNASNDYSILGFLVTIRLLFSSCISSLDPLVVLHIDPDYLI